MGPRNLHPDELGDAEGMDVQDALRVGNRLVESMDDLPITTRDDFSDRVMASIADEPTPGTTGFLVPLRRRGLIGGLADSVRQAWASVGGGRPMLGRSAALAYVLAVVVAGISLTGAATIGTAGALGLFNPGPTPSPTAPRPTVAPPTAPPSIAPAPSPSQDASEPPERPTPTPRETDDGPDASDDHGGNSGPGGGGDDSGSGGGDDSSGSGSDDSSKSGSGGGSRDSGSG